MRLGPLALMGFLVACNPGDVVETFNDERKLEVAPPEVSASVAEYDLVVRIDENSDILLDDKPVSLDVLRAHFEGLASSGRTRSLVVNAHQDAKNGVLLDVHKAAIDAKIEDIKIALDFQ